MGGGTALLAFGVIIIAGDSMSPQDWAKLYQALGFQAAGVPICPKAGDTALHFIDVGQGDAVLIQQDNEFCLIDAGTREAETDLLNYLDSLGVQSLKLLVMTHPHGDHIGSMRAVLRHLPVEQVLLPDFAKSDEEASYTLERVLDEIEEQGVPAVTARIGQTFPVGTGKLTVLRAGVETDEWNDISPVLRFDGCGLTFLDTGDGEKAVEENALQGGLNLSVIVFKAGHHGSNTSNLPEFLRAADPKYVVISCGLDNSYGHPDPEALDSFAAVGTQVLRTDQLGNVVISDTPQGVEIHSARNGRQQRAA